MDYVRGANERAEKWEQEIARLEIELATARRNYEAALADMETNRRIFESTRSATQPKR